MRSSPERSRSLRSLLLAACAKTVPGSTAPSRRLSRAPPAVLPPPPVVPPPPAECARRRRPVCGSRPRPLIDEAAAARALAAPSVISCPALQRRQDKSLPDVSRTDWTGVCARRPPTLDPDYAPRLLPSTVSTGCGSATARPSRPAITSPRSKDRGRRRRATSCRSTACRPTSSAAPSPTGRPAAAGSTRPAPACLYFTPRRDRGRSARRQGPRNRLGGGSGRPVLPRDPGLGRAPAARRQRDADRLRRPERPRLCRHRAAAARPRDPSAGRRQHAGDQGLDPRQSRPGPGADARELVLHLLQGADRAGPLGALGRAGHAARHRRRRSRISCRWARRSSSTMDRPEVDGLWVAQDTGGAIKGPNRFDTFWGAGPEAVAIAGGMSASGEALILLPKGVGGPCARSALRRPSCGRGSPRRSARYRANSLATRDQLKPQQVGSQRPATVQAAPSAPRVRPATPVHGRTAGSRPSTAAGTSGFARRGRARPRARPPRHESRQRLAGDRPRARAGHRRGERVVLLITGHHRPGEPPVQRGRIRAAVHDWLAASRHAREHRRRPRRAPASWRRRQPLIILRR